MTTSNESNRTLRGGAVRRRRWMILVGVIAVVLSGALAVGVWEYGRERAWWGESDAMRMVRAESLADPELLGFKLLKSVHEQRHDSLTTSGPSATNCFAIDGEPEAQMQQAIDYALAEGWSELPDTRTTTTWVGEKPASLGGEMNAIVSVIEGDDGGPCSRGTLRVSTTY